MYIKTITIFVATNKIIEIKMKKVLLSLTALSMLAFASCGGDEKEGDEDKKKGEDEKEVVEEKEEIEVIRLSVELDESYVWWHGWNANAPEDHTHNGKVKLSEGEIELTNGELTGGYAVIDISSIFGTDMAENEKKEKGLIGHLMSPDFFNIDSTGAGKPRFDVKSYENGVITGDLTINGNTNEVQVPATVSVSDDVVAVTSEKFPVDMMPFMMPYFAQEKEDSEAAILNPSIELEINLHGHLHGDDHDHDHEH